ATIDPANPHLRELANGLPLANLTGTLAARYGGQNPARGWARAKTGSLPGVTALTGTVITSQDRMLLFAVVADQAPQGGQWGARVALDNFIGSLAALGS
ncbi:MAG: D-alanyl-D-alanine carboxypeptidase, partial [Cellulomonadaceae bacterium]|nr:D-alanyl-D-alanine carboxypeptidase [Cellulomonadaceae bacterium]